MREYVTEAIVLEKEPVGELDERIALFTPGLGKIYAKIKSGRKIASKLSPHLEPLSVATVRLVEKNGLHLADALQKGRIAAKDFLLARLIAGVFLEHMPDRQLYALVARGAATVVDVFHALGLDFAHAVCAACGNVPRYFHPRDQIFFCEKCVPYADRNENLLMVPLVY